MGYLFLKNYCFLLFFIYYVYLLYIQIGVFMLNSDNPFSKFNSMQELIKQRHIERQNKINEIKAATDLNAVINFRVNGLLKEEFERICRDDQSTVSRVLKRYMLQVISKGKIE